jgi:hypothetical protein
MKSARFLMNRLVRIPLAIALLCAAAIPCAVPEAAAAKAKQKAYASPEEAVGALIEALKAGDKAGLLAVFGPGSEPLFSSGDAVVENAERERFLKAYDEKHSLDRIGADLVILQTGSDDWPFPIPIARKGTTWRFDTEAGKEEILDRRIGRNELRTIEVMYTYVAAQREYSGRDRDGDGVYAYAQKFSSAAGKKDGLYWPAREGEEASPLGPFAARAAREGYRKKGPGGNPSPYNGYYFRILKEQGKNAPGGAYSYVVKGNMILGFGLAAYPAKYGSSGIMTFIVNQTGDVYQKDLGKKTAEVAGAMKKFDPDATWVKVEDPSGK